MIFENFFVKSRNQDKVISYQKNFVEVAQESGADSRISSFLRSLNIIAPCILFSTVFTIEILLWWWKLRSLSSVKCWEKFGEILEENCWSFADHLVKYCEKFGEILEKMDDVL